MLAVGMPSCTYLHVSGRRLGQWSDCYLCAPSPETFYDFAIEVEGIWRFRTRVLANDVRARFVGRHGSISMEVVVRFKSLQYHDEREVLSRQMATYFTRYKVRMM